MSYAHATTFQWLVPIIEQDPMNLTCENVPVEAQLSVEIERIVLSRWGLVSNKYIKLCHTFNLEMKMTPTDLLWLHHFAPRAVKQ